MLEKQWITLKHLTGKAYEFLRPFYVRTLYVSLGENCITDNILARHGIKSFATVYSHCRSNIDYAIHLEQDRYRRLLNKQYLYPDRSGKKSVVRNKYYSKSSDIYNARHMKGFEFTHHDVINNETHRRSIERKIARLNRFRTTKKFVFFYHYRLNENCSLDAIFNKGQEFLKFYEGKKSSDFIIFTQKIVEDASQRCLEEVVYSANVRAFIIHSIDAWVGNNDIFWARNDDDLIAEMLKEIVSR